MGFDQNNAWAAAALDQFTQFSQTFYDPGSIFAQQIQYTTIGNTGWALSQSINSPQLSAIDSPNCQSGWAVGNSGTILNTVDAAHSWSPQAGNVIGTVGSANLYRATAESSTHAYALEETLEFASAFHGFGGFNLRVFETTDGGRNWEPDIPGQSIATQGISSGAGPYGGGGITSNSAGYAIAVGPGLVISVQPGGTWDTIDESPAALACGSVDECYTAWQAVSLSGTGDSAWAIDSVGDVIFEALPGSFRTWTQAGAPPAGGYYAIAAISASTAVILGGQSNFSTPIAPNVPILRTTNAGATWSPVTLNSSTLLPQIALYAISINASGTGWAAGSNGTILKTTDFGVSWTPQNWSDTSVTFCSVSITPDGTAAWVVGVKGQVCGYQFANGASSPAPTVLLYQSAASSGWTDQSPYIGVTVINGVAAVDPNSAWIVGLDGAILRTDTAGQFPFPKTPTP